MSQWIDVKYPIHTLFIFKPNKGLYLADACQELLYMHMTENLEDKIELHVYILIENFPFQNAILDDAELQILSKTILNDWPLEKSNMPDLIKSYFTYTDDLNIIDGKDKG